MLTFEAEGRTGAGDMALPEQGSGAGVLVLHAWWGLTPFFRDLCDRLDDRRGAIDGARVAPAFQRVRQRQVPAAERCRFVGVETGMDAMSHT